MTRINEKKRRCSLPANVSGATSRQTDATKRTTGYTDADVPDKRADETTNGTDESPAPSRPDSVEINASKKGGVYVLPFGGQLTIPPETVTKHAIVVCYRVPSCERHRHEPKLGNNEKLISEIIVLDTRGKPLKRPIGVQVSHQQVPKDVSDVGVIWRPNNSNFWQSAESCTAAGEVVNFSAPGGGSFAVVSYPRTERFELPTLGCLYSLRLHRQVSVRCPKGSVSADTQCDVQILPLKPESLQSTAAQIDIAAATDYFRFTLSSDVNFKRPLTVKLPLPVSTTTDVENINVSDIAICVQPTQHGGGDSWTLVDGPLKLSKNSVTFESRTLGKFWVVLVKPPGAARSLLPRGTRLADTLHRVELDNDRPRGDVLPFVQFTGKRWLLTIDVVRADKVQETIQNRSDMTLIKPSSLLSAAVSRPSDETIQRAGGGRFHHGWRAGGAGGVHQKDVVVSTRDPDVRLTSGQSFFVEVAGDLVIGKNNDEQASGQRDETDDGKRPRITYHELLTQNYRQFVLMPSSIETGLTEGKVLTCILKIYSSDEPGRPIRCFDFDVPPEVVAEFFYVEPPAPPPTAAATSRRRPSGSSESPTRHQFGGSSRKRSDSDSQPTAAPRRDPREVAETINRLTKPIRAPTIVPREPRVLSGRSLQCLAHELPVAGITLALHLDISESTITGMAFDALASGLTSPDITYRILLLWKRRAGHYRSAGFGAAAAAAAGHDAQVRMLADAVAAMGNENIASAILECHRTNRELTPECFGATDCNVENDPTVTGD